MEKFKKLIILLTIVGILLFSLVGCSRTLDPDDYTIEEHIEFITQKVQQRYMKEDYPYTSFAVYPLYDENDKNTHFLVEFEPYGFLMLQMHKQETSPFEYTSMYSRCDKYLCDQYNGKCGWQRYRYVTENEQQDITERIKWKDSEESYDSQEVFFEINEQGEYIVYYKSPYAISNALNQKLYFVNSCPLIEKNGVFINLVSMRTYTQEQNAEGLVGIEFFAGSILML